MESEWKLWIEEPNVCFRCVRNNSHKCKAIKTIYPDGTEKITHHSNACNLKSKRLKKLQTETNSTDGLKSHPWAIASITSSKAPTSKFDILCVNQSNMQFTSVFEKPLMVRHELFEESKEEILLVYEQVFDSWNSSWERAVQLKKNKHIVARILGVCVGALTYFHHTKDKVEILALGVAHDHQGKGIGRNLVQKLTSKYTSVLVQSDKSSVGFYSKIGFFVLDSELSRFKGKCNPDCTLMSFPDEKLSNECKYDRRVIYYAPKTGNCLFECIGYIFGLPGQRVRDIFTCHLSSSMKKYTHPFISLWNYAVLLSTDGFYAGELELKILSELAEIEVIVENYFKIGRGKKNRIVLQYVEDVNHYNLICFQVDSNTIDNFVKLESKFSLPQTYLFGLRCKCCGENFQSKANKDIKIAHYGICCKSPEEGIKHISKFF